jgi:hypothetical protein
MLLIPGIVASSYVADSGPVAGYSLWLDAADTSTITASGGDVSQWSDKSGFGRNFTQTSATAKPKTGTRTINSLNTIDFDGTNDFLVCPSSTALFNYLHNNTGGTLFFVGIVDDTAATKIYLNNQDGSTSNIGIRLDVTDTERDLIAVSRGVSGTSAISDSNRITYVAGSPFYTSMKVDSGNGTAAERYKISLNGGAFAGGNTQTAAASAGDATSNLHLGIVSDGVSVPYDGCFGEVIFYSGILSAGDIEANQTYLANKWGI